MAGASDPLLLTKAAAKLVKGAEGVPGTLLLSQARVRWQPANAAAAGAPGGAPASLELAAITRQQQAPGKPMLRLLGGAEPLALAFESEADKLEVLDLLKQLLAGGTAAAPPAPGVPPPALRARLFAADPDLQALHAALVAGGVLQEGEFWRGRRADVERLERGGGASGSRSAASASASTATRQRAGLPSLLHDVERSHDGGSEKVSIRLTPADVARIFAERPDVRAAFAAHVPHAVPEKAFWERYFKLEYKRAARARRAAASTGSRGASVFAGAGGAGGGNGEEEGEDEEDELFGPFRRAAVAAEAAAAAAAVRLVDPGLNLAAEAGERWSAAFGAGAARAGDDAGAAGAGPAGGGAPGGAYARDSIAHSLNRHAAHVLAGAPEGLALGAGGAGGGAPTSAEIAARVAAAVAAAAPAPRARGAGPAEAPAAARAAWQAAAVEELEDLTLGDAGPGTVPLEVRRGQRALFGAGGGAAGGGGSKAGGKRAAPAAAAAAADPLAALRAAPAADAAADDPLAALRAAPAADAAADDPLAALRAAAAAAADIDPRALRRPPFAPAAAAAALLELGRGDGAALEAEFGPGAAAALSSSPADALGPVMVEFFRLEALKANELLRHLWACLPPSTPARREKAARLAPAAAAARRALAAHAAADPGGGGARRAAVALMVRPLLRALDAALDRHAEAAAADG
jgi:hypothetical protein